MLADLGLHWVGIAGALSDVFASLLLGLLSLSRGRTFLNIEVSKRPLFKCLLDLILSGLRRVIISLFHLSVGSNTDSIERCVACSRLLESLVLVNDLGSGSRSVF